MEVRQVEARQVEGQVEGQVGARVRFRDRGGGGEMGLLRGRDANSSGGERWQWSDCAGGGL